MKKKSMAKKVSVTLYLLIASNAFATSYVVQLNDAIWSDTNTWSKSTLPGLGDSVYIRSGNSVTYDSSAGTSTINNFFVGGASSVGTLNITGGKLITTNTSETVVTRRSAVGLTASNAVGSLNLTGGTLQIGVSSGTSVLFIGTDTNLTSAHCTGTLTISGGTFDGRLYVGSDIPGDSGDTVRIEGNAATIGTQSTVSNALYVGSSGTIEFIFNTNGISTIDYGASGSGGTTSFSTNSQILVNGASYTGSSNTFTLIKAGTLGGQNCTVTLTNFAAGTAYNWDITNNTFTVSVTGPSNTTSPERPAASYILSLDNSNWTNPAVWTLNDGTIPESLDSVYVRNGQNVTINSDVGSINNFFIGEATQSGTINITAGGKLTTLYTGTTSRSCVGRPYAGGTATGYFNLSGGTLNINTDGSEVLNVGVNGSTTQGTGIFTISGGTFNGRLLVGSAVAGDSGDKVRIEGSGASIGTASTVGNALEVRASGSLEFIFGTNGISMLNYGTSGNGGTVSFANGSKIIVNGVYYTGEAQTFTLLTAGSIGTIIPTITLTNFAGGTTYNWDTVNEIFTVSISGPSPARPASDLPYTVYVYNLINDANNTSIDEMMASVAGLANRYYPGEMLAENRVDWLDRLCSEYPEVEKNIFHSSDWAWFINHYRGIFKGYILYDKAANAESLDVATSIAGIEDALIVDSNTLAYATNAGLTMIIDVRSKTQDWAWSTYSSSFNKNEMFHEGNSSGRLTGFWLRDYAIMNKGFSFYLPNDIGNYLGTQNKAGLLFGFGSEDSFFSAASQNNQQTAVSDYLSGASATSGWKTPIKPQPVHIPLDATPSTNKHYVAFVVSDGDNVAYLHKTFVNSDRLFASPYRGNFKMTWDLSPAFAEVNPFGVNYTYGLAGIDKFICSGGHGLFYPTQVPDLTALAIDTADAMRAVDQNIISILDSMSGFFTFDMSKSAALINQPQIIGAMYKTYTSAYKGLNGSIYWSSNGKPIVSVKYSLWDGYDTPTSIASALNSAVRDPYHNTASYSIVNIHPWSTNYVPMEGVNIIVANLNSNVEVVTLEELMIYLRNGYGTSHGYRPVREVYYWDRNGTTSGAGTSPSGTWGSDTAWNSNSNGTGTVQSWPTNVVASFSAGSDATGSYIVNVANTQLVNGLEFDEGSVTLNGGTIDITGNTEIRVSSGSHEINSKVQGVGNLIKTGAGDLTLANDENTFTGSLSINGGSLSITGMLDGKKSVTVKTGATFENTGYITGNIGIETGGTYTGNGTVMGNLLNNGTMRITGGNSFNIIGTVTNNGILDIMTGTALPVNLVNNGTVLDSTSVGVASLHTSTSSFSVTIQGYSGHGYQLQKAETLFSAWVNVGSAQNGITQSDGTPTALTFSDSSTPSGKGFYRIVVSP